MAQNAILEKQQENQVLNPHWTSIKFSPGILTDALSKHVLGVMPYGMSDLGETLEALGQCKDGSEESWITAWSDLARRLQQRAEKAEQSGKKVSACTSFVRAATYWRVSLMYFSIADDSRIKANTAAAVKCYEKYLELSNYPGTYVEIPYENGFLPGHFYKSPIAAENAPLLIVTPGRDTWGEDTVWIFDAAIRRGIHCLVYEGLGQGIALRLHNLTFRHDWENVLSPVIDFGLTLPGVDATRIGVVGLSFGGFLVPRAAAFDKRIKVCVADTGNLNWGGMIGARLKAASGLPYEKLPPPVKNLVLDYSWKHGVPNTVDDVIKELNAYDNTNIVGKITCKTLVMDGTEEVAYGEAHKFYDALNCPKDYMLFDATTTAQLHCQMGGYATAAEYLFDWLEDNL